MADAPIYLRGMIVRLSTFGLIFGAALALGYLPTGAAADDLEICANQSGDVAIAACSRAIASGRYHGSALAATYYTRGVRYYEKNDLDRAIADFNKAILIFPISNVYVNRGLAWYAKKEYERATADFDEAIKRNPANVDAYKDRGAAWANRGEFGRAIADFDQAIKLDPNDAETYFNRGLAKRDNGDTPGGDADIAAAKKINPEIGN